MSERFLQFPATRICSRKKQIRLPNPIDNEERVRIITNKGIAHYDGKHFGHWMNIMSTDLYLWA